MKGFDYDMGVKRRRQPNGKSARKIKIAGDQRTIDGECFRRERATDLRQEQGNIYR